MGITDNIYLTGTFIDYLEFAKIVLKILSSLYYAVPLKS